jgi:hypothetical protein
MEFLLEIPYENYIEYYLFEIACGSQDKNHEYNVQMTQQAHEHQHVGTWILDLKAF